MFVWTRNHLFFTLKFVVFTDQDVKQLNSHWIKVILPFKLFFRFYNLFLWNFVIYALFKVSTPVSREPYPILAPTQKGRGEIGRILPRKYTYFNLMDGMLTNYFQFSIFWVKPTFCMIIISYKDMLE